MNFSALFIHRPAGTTLLTIALALAGIIAYQFLPVSPLPQVEYATIEVQTALPGASPEIMASAVATPLERQFGRIAGLNEMTSSSLQQKVSQVPGVGRVVVGGGALPAVRVAVNPTVLNGYGLSLEDVRAVLSTANANRPKGEIVDNGRAWTPNTTDQLLQA